MKEYSARGDYSDLLKWLSYRDRTKIMQLFLVNGEKESMRNVEVAEKVISYQL